MKTKCIRVGQYSETSKLRWMNSDDFLVVLNFDGKKIDVYNEIENHFSIIKMERVPNAKGKDYKCRAVDEHGEVRNIYFTLPSDNAESIISMAIDYPEFSLLYKLAVQEN